MFLTSEDNSVSPSAFRHVNGSYWYRYFVREPKSVGGIVHLSSWNYQNLFGLVLKRSERDQFKFSHFEKCLQTLLDHLQLYRFNEVAFESFGDRFFMAKVTSVIKHVFEFSEQSFYICKPQMGWTERRNR